MTRASTCTAALLALLTLAACGADGEPITPSMNTNIGVGANGVSTSTSVNVRKGPISFGVGLGL